MEFSTPPVDPLLGTVFGGKYRIIEKVGTGGMGGIYRAEHLLMARMVAIKVIRSHLLDDELQRKRFRNEAQTASQLLHPNAVTLFDFGVEDKVPYLVMEFIDGKTLKEIISQEKALSLARVRSILEQISSALTAAHKLGIIHRDLKPENIMLRRGEDDRDEVKVLDFGVAKLIGPSKSDTEQNLTVAGMIVGTPQYMSPEQCKGEDLDVRSDIYSLGALTYEMLSGEIPFRAPSVLELLIKVVNERPQTLRESKPELLIPETIDRVVAKSLEKSRENRFSSVAEFFAEFDQAAREVLSPQEIEPPKPPLWKSPLLWGGGAVIAALLVIVGTRDGTVSVSPSNPALEQKAREIEEATKELEKQRREAIAHSEKMRKEVEARSAELARQDAARDAELRAKMEAAMQAEVEKDQAVRQAEAAKAELAILSEAAKKAEEEKAAMALQVEAAKKEEAKREELRRIEESKRKEQQNQVAVIAPPPVVDPELEQKRKAEQARLEAIAKQALLDKEAAERKAEALKVEAARQAAAAKRAQELAEKARAERAERRRQEMDRLEPPPPPPIAKQPPPPPAREIQEPEREPETPAAPKRRRCGPNWCM